MTAGPAGNVVAIREADYQYGVGVLYLSCT